MSARGIESNDAFGEFHYTDSILINTIIEKLKSNLSVLSVGIEKTNISFISAIIDIDGNLRHIVIDELISTISTNKNLGKETLMVSGKLDGVSVTFKSNFINFKGLDAATHRIAFPKALEYKQRRQTHRVNIARELSPNAYMLIDKKWVNFGRVCDLSEEGLCIIDNNSLHKDYYGQSEIHQLKLVFPNTEEIYCSITSANIIPDKNSQRRLGAKFISLHEPEKSRLLRTMMSFERDNIKKGISR